MYNARATVSPHKKIFHRGAVTLLLKMSKRSWFIIDVNEDLSEEITDDTEYLSSEETITLSDENEKSEVSEDETDVSQQENSLETSLSDKNA